MPSERSSFTTGLILGLASYLMWGVFPLYFGLLDSVSPVEIVAHRIVWSVVFLVIIILAMRRWPLFVAVFKDKRALGLLALAAVFIAINWGTYVYAISVNQLVQSSFGYIVNPLIAVALGVLFLREKMRGIQWLAIGIAGIAVIVLSLSYAGIPWIALTLAFSFALYGLAKKLAGVHAIDSLAVETALLTPIALVFLVSMEARGVATFAADGWGISILLILLGPVTAIPLLAFGGAAIRIPLSTLGLMQYINPLMQFLIGWLIFGEVMNTLRWLGFGIVAIAVAIFMADSWNHRNDTTKLESDIESLEVPDPT